MSYSQYSRDEAEQHGRDIYEREVCPQYVQDRRGELVIIDPETGEYVVGGDMQEAIDRLQSRNPGVHLYAAHIGIPDSGHILRRLYGGGSLAYRRINDAEPSPAMIEQAWERGTARYEQIRRQVEPGNERKTVVINTQTSEYAIGNDLPQMLGAIDTPGVIVYTHRIGFIGYSKPSYRGLLSLLASRKRSSQSS